MLAPLVLGIVAVALAAFAIQSADAAAAALWPLVVMLVLAFATIALFTWHRRQMAHLQQLHLVVVGRYADVNIYRPWPKYCTDCGQTIESWRQAGAHDDETSSPCMKLRIVNDAADAAPGLPARYTAEVIEPKEEGPTGPELPDPKAQSRAIVDKLRARSE